MLKSLMLVLTGLCALLFCSAGIIVVEKSDSTQTSLATREDLFPQPELIKSKVEFWKKIFTRYSSNQVLIHDAWNLDRVYEVIDFKRLRTDGEMPYYLKWRVASGLKRFYIEQFSFLHRYPSGHPEGSLSPFQSRLVKMLEDDERPDKFRIAAENVRVQFGLSDRFKQGIETLGKYRPYMVGIFKHYNLPLELLVIPLYESSFVLRAVSYMDAVGVWQLMPYTASRYLRMNRLVDERYDPIFATEAAAKLLKHNYRRTRSWPLAITAYNHGLLGMLRAGRELKTNNIGVIIYNYESPSFQFASRNFYPEFLAALYCLENMYDLYNNIEFEPTWRFLKVKLRTPRTLREIAQRTGVSIDEISEFNPSFRSPLTKGSAPLWKGYELRLPVSAAGKVKGL